MWHFVAACDSGGSAGQKILTIARNNNRSSDCSRGSDVGAKSTVSYNAGRNSGASYYRNTYESFQGGGALTHQLTNAGLNVVIPNMNNSLFCYTKPSTITKPSTGPDGASYETCTLRAMCHPAQGNSTRTLEIMKHVGVGSDFSLHYFVGVPVSYWYSSIPPPVLT